jgi:hypothetical protein
LGSSNIDTLLRRREAKPNEPERFRCVALPERKRDKIVDVARGGAGKPYAVGANSAGAISANDNAWDFIFQRFL